MFLAVRQSPGKPIPGLSKHACGFSFQASSRPSGACDTDVDVDSSAGGGFHSSTPYLPTTLVVSQGDDVKFVDGKILGRACLTDGSPNAIDYLKILQMI